MPWFDVQWMLPDGRIARQRVEAAQAGAVAEALGVGGSRVLSAVPVAAVAGRAVTAAALPHWRQKGLDQRLFAQELSLLLDAGVPVLEAVQTLREKAGVQAGVPTENRALAALVLDLEQGLGLSAALARAPGVFDGVLVALVAASEQSGQLAAALRNHAVYLAWSGELRHRLQSALLYPALLLLAGLGVTLFLLMFVLPRFAGVFEGLETDLPLASRWLLAAGTWAGAHPGSLGLAVLLGLTSVVGLALHGRSRTALQQALWHSPWIGQQWRTVMLARWYRCLGLLVDAGVTVPRAMALAQPLLKGPLEAKAQQAVLAVEQGHRLSHAMSAAGLATPVAERMVRVGESGGQLGAMLGRAAAFHDEEIARLVDFVGKALNPALMMVMGVVIGGIVVLMYLPIFTLMEQVQ